jgi:acetolactate synthase-1/2/3 large subunit
MKLSGSKIILKVLKEKGIDTLFGYPGGAVIPFFDALYDELDYFKVYRPAHEQNGVHAADAISLIGAKRAERAPTITVASLL